MRKNVTVILLLLLIAVSCKQREKNLEFLEEKIVQLGYTGEFEKPAGGFQRMALGLVGVDNYLAFKGEESSFVIFQLKSDNEKDVIERLESVLSLADKYIREDDRKNIAESKELLREQSFQHGKILLLWENQKPEDLVKVIRRNF
ncbi:MAG: hypothetical protein EA361_03400 [Bacteroidetes bacterium]|nr:MAG: hypothetical protein EA361_03400 [Bacteroidota bacterium]